MHTAECSCGETEGLSEEINKVRNRHIYGFRIGFPSSSRKGKKLGRSTLYPYENGNCVLKFSVVVLLQWAAPFCPSIWEKNCPCQQGHVSVEARHGYREPGRVC